MVLKFAERRARDVPLFVAALPIFSRAYYSAHNFEETTLEVPLGCGPYKVGKFEAGRYIEYDRVKDWWGADLPIARGQNNFDTVRFEFYRDRDVGFEGFTAKNYLFREEFTARTWATRYDFPALKDGRVKQAVLPDDTPSGGQGWFMNSRREKFKNAAAARGDQRRVRFRVDQQDHHVRRLQAHGLGVPEFQHDGAGQAGRRRAGAARAVPRQGAGRSFRRTLCAAGLGRLGPGPRCFCARPRNCCSRPDTPSRTASGSTPRASRSTIEFLIDEPTFQPHHMPFIKNLATLGIDATLRIVDPVQYRKRVDEFDFDITVERFSFSTTPGDSLRSYLLRRSRAPRSPARTILPASPTRRSTR